MKSRLLRDPATLLALLVAAFLSLWFVAFPAMLWLDRDLQLNGVQTTAEVMACGQTRAKNGDTIHKHQVRFLADGDPHLVWIVGPPWCVIGGPFEVRYAPSYPDYAVWAKANRDPWDAQLWGRALAGLLIGGVGLAMGVGIWRRTGRA